MRLAIPAHPLQGKLSSKVVLTWSLGLGVGLAAVVAATTLAHDRLFHAGGGPGGGEAKAPADPGGEAKKAGPDPTTTVVLPDGKFKTAEIRVEPASAVEMPREVAVTGRIEADPNRRVEIRPRAQGVVRTTPVLPGTTVKAGDVLVVLESPDVGSARLKVRERQRELATVRVDAAWKGEIASNSKVMIQRLREGATAPEIARQFDNKSLGMARGTLIAAWAELELASHEYEKMTDLKQKNIIGEHPLYVAEHTREGSQAKFKAALETVGFDVAQQDRVARQMVRNAEEAVVDAAQRLRILGVAEDINDLLAHPERASALPSGSEDVTAYPIVAPIDGTVISTTAVRSQRVDVTDPLFVVADLSRVYAVANVTESDFAVLPSLSNGKVRMTASAYPGQVFEATMLYAGAEVDPITRSVRLVAEAANPGGLLKLGLFTRILLDTQATDKVTTVPAGSVVEIDNQPAVFVPGRDDHTFVKRPVKLGREALGRQVIAEGLKPGDRVVVAGTFLIKSELILQNEAPE